MSKPRGFFALRKAALAAFVIGVASCGGGGGGGSSTAPRFAASSGPCSNGVAVGTLSLPTSIAARTSGNIPLAVFFDATGTTSSAQSDAFAGIYYSWDFGDTNAGSWGDTSTSSAGSGANLSRNAAYGPLAAHVFEAAGSFTVTLTAFDGTSSASCTIPITTTDWTSSSTICVSTTGITTGCPAGAALAVNTNDFAAAIGNISSLHKRLLFRCGETWTTATGGYNLATAGPGLVGAYNDNGPVTRANPLGGCAAPKVTVTSTDSMISVGNNVSDWRIMDLEFDGGAGIDSRPVDSNFPSSSITVLRLNAHFTEGIYIDSLTTTQNIDNWTVQDTSITDYRGVAIWAEHQPTNLALLGNKFWDSHGEHNVRVQGVRKFVMNHNSGRNAGISSAGPKENFTVRESDQTVSGTGTVQWVVSSDNRTDSTRTGAANGGYAAQTIDGVVVDAIFERNFYVAGTIGAGFFFNGPQALASGLPANKITLRNNVFQGTVTGQTDYVGISGNSGAMTSGGLFIFNNTVYSGSAGTNVVGIDLVDYDRSHVKNNLLYAPNAAAVEVVGGGTNNDATKNTLSASDDPHFSAPLNAVAGFKPTCVTAVTYPCGQGTATPLPGVWTDLLQADQPSPTDLGAVVH